MGGRERRQQPGLLQRLRLGAGGLLAMRAPRRRPWPGRSTHGYAEAAAGSCA